MGLIDQMKYAKILYLADVLEDIQNEMNRDYRCHSYARSISGIVEDLRKTVADTTPPNEMECEKIEIKRLENKRMVSMLDVPRGEIEMFEKCIRRSVESELLNHISDEKLIRVHKFEDHDRAAVTFTASLIVGIEKQHYVPEEPSLTPVDFLAKWLDERRKG